jgi:hypothetical protein
VSLLGPQPEDAPQRGSLSTLMRHFGTHRDGVTSSNELRRAELSEDDAYAVRPAGV